MKFIYLFLSCSSEKTTENNTTTTDTSNNTTVVQDTSVPELECPDIVELGTNPTLEPCFLGSNLTEPNLVLVAESLDRYSPHIIAGQMNDDNNDGVIDSNDNVDILATAQSVGSSVTLLSSNDLATQWDESDLEFDGFQFEINPNGSLAGAINTNSDLGLFLTVRSRTKNGECHPAKINVGGRTEWVNENIRLSCDENLLSVFDIENDGTPDVFAEGEIVDGDFGIVKTPPEWKMDGNEKLYYIADLNQDGKPECISNLGISETNNPDLPHLGRQLPAFADFDQDNHGEVVFVTEELTLLNKYLEIVTNVDLVGTGFGSPPTITDFDGDGVPEIAILDDTHIAVYEANGDVVWSFQLPFGTQDTGVGHLASFDFYGDGYIDLLVVRDGNIHIYDGRYGEKFVEMPIGRSGVPYIMDFTNDGEADILLSGETGISLFSAPDSDWRQPTAIWNQRAFSHSNIDENWRLPTELVNNFSTQNSFGCFDPNPPDIGSGAQFELAELTTCLDDCDKGWFTLDVTAQNNSLPTSGTGQFIVSDSSDQSISSESISIDDSNPTAARILIPTTWNPPFSVHFEYSGNISECSDAEVLVVQDFCELED